MVSEVIDYEFELTLGYGNCNDLRPVIVMDVINIILVRKDLSNVILTRDLIKYPKQKFKLNLTIYFTYNFVTISLVTGLLCDIAISFVLAPA
jgi:cation transport ATPase